MSKETLTVVLYLAAGVSWLIAFAISDSGARWMYLFPAAVFLGLGLWRLNRSRRPPG